MNKKQEELFEDCELVIFVTEDDKLVNGDKILYSASLENVDIIEKKSKYKRECILSQLFLKCFSTGNKVFDKIAQNEFEDLVTDLMKKHNLKYRGI